ncbi:DUF2188 domain-containing protein [Prescottella equi]|uniref:DUF2188 domain-containing protein n=1 Tax=Rhodococcus hoagii TaxID=43767 RepID=UPI0009B5D6B9|nr:DUF2188 domain-containing protein [Prescottella equi]
MATPDRRHVVPDPNGGWNVRAPGAQRASAHTNTQAEAQAVARRILGNSRGGELVTHGRDGQIRASDTVAPGNDPFPPRG